MSMRDRFKKRDLNKLQDKVEEISGKKSYDDPRFWSLKPDKAGNASAIIRFLPEKEGENAPFICLKEHFFQGPSGKYYTELSLKTLGKADPVAEHIAPMWNGSEQDKNFARKLNAKTKYVANVYVVKDPANSENAGKVFLFKFGKQIFDKLERAWNPLENDIVATEAKDPFHFLDGGNFIVRIKKKDGYINYDDSEFLQFGPLFDIEQEDKFEEVIQSMHSLDAFLKPDQFKSYDELKVIFNDVMSGKAKSTISKNKVENIAPETVDVDDEDDIDESVFDMSSSDDDSDIAFLKNLVDGV